MDAKERTDVGHVVGRDVVLYIAMSLDGYIADRDGGVSWLEACGEATLDEGDAVSQAQEAAYAAFEQSADAVVLGWNTYHQIVAELSPDHWVYGSLQSYVVTHRGCRDLLGITFTDEDPCELVDRLRREPGCDTWVCGGANIIRQLMRKDLIDVYRVSLVPVVLGGGGKLFGELDEPLPLRPMRAESCSGIVELIYRRSWPGRTMGLGAVGRRILSCRKGSIWLDCIEGARGRRCCLPPLWHAAALRHRGLRWPRKR